MKRLWNVTWSKYEMIMYTVSFVIGFLLLFTLVVSPNLWLRVGLWGLLVVGTLVPIVFRGKLFFASWRIPLVTFINYIIILEIALIADFLTRLLFALAIVVISVIGRTILYAEQSIEQQNELLATIRDRLGDTKNNGE